MTSLGYSVTYRGQASWQLLDAVERWKRAAAERQELRLQTANAFQYLYLSLGQRAIKSWQEGVSYQQKVPFLPLLAFQSPWVNETVKAWHEGMAYQRKVLS